MVEVYYYHRKKKQRYDLSQVVESVERTGSVERLYRSANIIIADKQGVTYDTGERVRVFKDKQLFFDGRVFRVDHDARGRVTLLCYDNAYYFTKNEVNVVYRPVGQAGNEKGITLSDMVKRLATRAKVPIGAIKQTTFGHGNINFVGETAQTVLQALLALEHERGKRRYYYEMRGQLLDLRERGGIDGILVSNDVTYNASSTLDATSTYTSIRAVGKVDETTAGSASKATGTTRISSSYYQGPDSTNYQSGFKTRLKNTDQWDDLIMKVANKQGVDPLMLKIIVMMESSGNTNLTSSDGAGSMGLTQITPGNVGTYVKANRLFEPEYNLEKACEILKNNEKLGAVKRRPAVPNVKNMAHIWNGWHPDQGEDESPYANTFATIYKGFGGDPNTRFDQKSVFSEGLTTPPAEPLVNDEEPPLTKQGLVNKLGLMTKIVSINADSKQDFDVKAREMRDNLREQRRVTLDLSGHPSGIAGRRVRFQDNAVARATWYIHSDTHRLDSSGHTMTLEVSPYDETPTPEAPPYPAEDKAPSTKVNSNPDGGTGKFIRPAEGVYTQGWGPATFKNPYYTFHNGVDIANAVGTKVIASDGGMVERARSAGALGKHVRIVHAINQKRWTTVYGHLSEINVKEGQFVKQGDVIGKMGSTGNSSGSHLHFSIHQGDYSYDPHGKGNTVNPREYF